MTRIPRIFGILLIVLGVVVAALGVIPSGGLAGRLNGVRGSGHLTADAVLLVGALLVLGGLVVALRGRPARPVRPGDATAETISTPPPPMAEGSQLPETEPPDQSNQEALATGESPETPPAVPPQPPQESEEPARGLDEHEQRQEHEEP